MTDEELKALVASLAINQKAAQDYRQEMDELFKETRLLFKEIAEDRKETERLQQETEVLQQETERQLQKTDLQLQESERQFARQMKELGKQIGGLGEKFGGFTEGMAFPSMTRLLTEEFGMEFITPRTKKRLNGETLELDVLAYANSSTNRVFVVEVKSHLRADGITQFLNILQRFPRFFPEHSDKTLHGILAVVDAPEDLRREALQQGIYMAGIHDDLFAMETPADFTPKNWMLPAQQQASA